MKSVYFASSFWDDDFVFELNHVTKLFYIFLITNKNVLPSGMYKLGKIEKLKTGLTQPQIRKAFQELKGKIYVFGEWIFIKNLLYKSFLENSSEEKFKNSNIFKMVVGQLSKNNLPYQLVELFIENYPILTPYKPLQAPYKAPPPPLLHTDTDTESYTETKTESYTEKNLKHPTTFGNGFEIFWKTYPKKQGKAQALKVWNKIKPDDNLLQAMLANIEIAKTTQSWIKQNGQFIPLPATWLNGERWLDEHNLQEKNNSLTGAELITEHQKEFERRHHEN